MGVCIDEDIVCSLAKVNGVLIDRECLANILEHKVDLMEDKDGNIMDMVEITTELTVNPE